MARRGTGLVLFAIAVFAIPADASAARADDVAALTKAKLDAWPGFYRANDADGLAAFLADGFVQFAEDGSRETKAEAVEWVRRNKWANADTNFRYTIGDIVFYADDVANVYGTGAFDGKGAAGPCRLSYTSANMFVKQAGRWRPIFSHTTRAECSADGATKGNE